MLSAYFDASGGKDHGFIVVAGYVSRLSRWERFAVDWRLVLARYKIPNFHMKEFSQSKGPFTSWKECEVRRENLLRDLVSVIKDHVDFGVSSLVPYQEFMEVDKEYHLNDTFICPYVLAGRDCVATVNKELKKKGWNEPVKYVFERGDSGKGRLIDLLDAVGLPIPTFEPSRDEGDIKGAVQLQASDFAAYELRKAMKDHGENAPLWKYRRSLMGLAKLENYWMGYTKANLVELCKDGLIPQRTESSRVRVFKRKPKKNGTLLC